MELHDIQLPNPVSIWPPAPGWWLLFILTVAVLFLLGRTLSRRYQKAADKRSALKISQQLFQRYQSHQDSHVLLNELSKLLRRLAVQRFSKHQVARLHGQAWLAFLDDTLPKSGLFTQGIGQLLGDSRYQPEQAELSQNQMMELQNLVKSWIKAQ
ncbi:Uncharacterised protein [Candidatus Venteria ishoeyi]|uniref:DUF4381 domain-containing protein n=2 Tax=Candidatus Venteria ishoeyi TaxID=1899563 RepID=A0A1H6FEV3_9GAMM|nr:Uncharacterised protein [Candidatus Venteria ishoeyi]